MTVCKVCKGEKPTRDMRMWGGLATETCQACYDERKAGKAPAPSPTVPVAPPTAPKANGQVTEIVVEASLGFAAKLDGDSLVISQANASRENDDDNVTLTRSEARKLFDLFGEWIVGT